MESPLFINYENKNLFGVLHTPENRPSKKGIIFLHPYAEEKQRIDRIFVHMARLLCAKGYSAIRFDFYGCGDSEGNFEEVTIDSQISDLRNVRNMFVREKGIDEISLFGIRLGANIAIQYAGMDKDIEKLILWSPIINGAEYAETLIRNKIFSSLMDSKIRISKEQILSTLDSEGCVDIDGFYLTKQNYEYLNNMDAYTKSLNSSCEAFIGITKSETSIITKYESFAKKLRIIGNKCDLVLTDDKMYWDQRTHYEWYFPDNLIKQTIDWILHH